MKNVNLFLSGTLCLSALNAANAKDVKPNVIFIAVDDMNDWINPLGGLKGIKTPNLDRLASMGVTFTKCSLCGSSKCTISTFGDDRCSSGKVKHHAQYIL